MLKKIISLSLLLLVTASSNIFSHQQNSPREVELKISGDFPRDVPIDPEIVTLGGKDVRDNLFLPGTYKLEIQQPGYIPIHEEIVILPDDKPYLLIRVLITKPRKLTMNITYDVPPPSSLEPYKITIEPEEQLNKSKEVKEGDFIKPGAYLLKIEKPAYETLEIKQFIWPSEHPFSIEQTLKPKQVILDIHVTHDIEPPKHALPYRIILTNKKRTLPLRYGNKIIPGEYDFRVTQPGYYSDPYKSIHIFPSEEPFVLREKLTANKRQISFDTVKLNTGICIEPREIFDLQTQRKFVFEDTYQPGETVSFRIEFEKYETQQISSLIVPGEGPFIIPVPIIEKQND